ncbi:ABC transporter ATP-binding protein [Halomicroarcula sp. S1AR25-4]|uniref:ABC transporter ATP-binding protein n=1 Tax=Haloarcula sp. S1AR25-4 TaxID=2950538 RepID=UPI0028742806|nr:ABC transporter ATP-binding protein [Halomicroarcula sp. S1AR25-4]MDS0277464.1 ABC transporter ATP-binding protein [Halomicroarcula sp. S1AR25-4]
MSVIDIDDVSKAYGEVQALDGLSLSVDRGTTLGVFGTNGAGKTTLFKLLAGLNRPDSGEVTVAGGDPTETAVRGRVRYLPEDAGFPPNLTGREILRFHARVRSTPAERREHHVERVLDTVGLTTAADRRVGGYSNGMNRRLGLGTALVGRPEILVLDEPTAGLDPEGIRAFHEVIESLSNETDVTIVFASHALSEIERLCTDAAVVVDGDVAVAGPVESLRCAAGDAVTVRLTLSTLTAAEDAASHLRRQGATGSVTRAGTVVEADCLPAAAYDLVCGLGPDYDVERFAVREPGLEAAFHEAVDAAPPASLDDSGQSGGETA